MHDWLKQIGLDIVEMKLKYNAHHMNIPQTFGVTYPWFCKQVPRLLPFFIVKGSQNRPYTRLKSSHFLTQNQPCFLPKPPHSNRPRTKTNFSPNKRSELL